MKRRILRGSVALTGLIVAACTNACSSSPSSSTKESVGTAESAETPLALGGNILPVPRDKGETLFKGRPSDLLLADAFAVCTTSPGDAATPLGHAGDVSDAVLTSLQGAMNEALGRVSSTTKPADWIALRKNASLNEKPLSQSKRAVELVGEFPAHYDVASLDLAGDDAAVVPLRTLLTNVGVNLCIARKVREQLELGAGLLMTTAEQLAMNETIRTRAQLAMLGLATAFRALTPTTIPETMQPYVTLDWRLLRTWSAKPEAAKYLALWGEDLADAVRLHVASVDRLTDLLARSAAGEEPLPGGVIRTPDGFQANGWRRRLLALLYGGAPLTQGNPGVPTPHGAATAAPWPDRTLLPVARSGLWTPDVVRTWLLARRSESVVLVLTAAAAAYTGPQSVDADATAKRMFREVEANLRNEACGVSPSDTCPLEIAENIALPESDDGSTHASYRAHQRHGLTLGHFRQLTAALLDVLPSTNGAPGFHLRGETRRDEVATGPATPSGAPKRQAVRFDRNVEITPPTLEEAASVYTRLAGFLSPNPAQTLGHGAEAEEQRLLEGERALGASPALAAVRDVLLALKEPGASAAAGAVAKAARSDALLGTLDAVVGPTHITLEPVVGVTSVGGKPTPTQVVTGTAVGTTPRLVWQLRLRGFGSLASGSDLSVVAVAATSEAREALVDPSRSKAGFRSASAILAGDGNLANRTRLVAVGGSGVLQGRLEVPAGQEVLLVLEKRTRGGFERSLIAGPVVLTADVAVDGDRTYARPAKGLQLAFGGVLGQRARAAYATHPLDPARPAVDGFAQIGEQPPEPSPATRASPAPIQTYTDELLNSAETVATDAKDALAGVITSLKSDVEGEVDTDEARGRALFASRAALTKLCGSAAASAGSSDADKDRTAAQACAVDFVKIPPHGSSSEELQALCGEGVLTATPSFQALGSERACTDLEAERRNPKSERLSVLQTQCTLHRLSKEILAIRVEVPKAVACAQYSPTPPVIGEAGTTLSSIAADQWQALTDYRTALIALNAEADTASARARQADLALVAALQNLKASDDRVRNEVLQQENALARVAQDIKDGDARVWEAEDYRRKLGISGEEKMVDTAGKVAAGVAGTVAAAAAGPVGAVFAALGAFASLFGGGPSDEEISLANAKVNEAKRQRDASRAEFDRQYQNLGGPYCAPDASSCDAPAGTVYRYAWEQLRALRASASAEKQNSVVSLAETRQRLLDHLVAMSKAAGTFTQKNVAIHDAILSAQLELEKARLEARFAQQRAEARFAIDKMFHAFAMWDAASKGELARRSLASARRGIEFAMATNLSSLTKALALDPTAPADWAAEVFDADYFRDAGGTQALDGNKLTLYKTRLTAVRNSLLQYGPQILSDLESDVVELPGPAAKISRIIRDPQTQEDVTIELRDPVAQTWEVQCPPQSACAPEGGYCPISRTPEHEGACYRIRANENEPEERLLPSRIRVRLAFNRKGYLDIPRVIGVNELDDKRFNARWVSFGLNLTGVGIVDCRRAPNTSCPTEANLLYTLQERGPFVFHDASRTEDFLLPLAVRSVQGDARATGAPLSRNPTADLGSRMRKELFFYPVEGEYELVVSASALADLERIEKVQIAYTRYSMQPR